MLPGLTDRMGQKGKPGDGENVGEKREGRSLERVGRGRERERERERERVYVCVSVRVFVCARMRACVCSCYREETAGTRTYVQAHTD